MKCEHIREIYGVTSLKEKIELLNYIGDNDEESIVKRINEYDDKGVDLTRLTIGLIDLLKEVIIYKNSNNKKILKVIDEASINEFKEKNVNRLFKWIDILVDALSNYKKVNAPKSFFELACLKMGNMDSVKKENIVYVTKEPVVASEPIEVKKTVVEKVVVSKEETPVSNSVVEIDK